jgi:Ran GTPase-activating protein (RanGAP) involved in mRNA processing and transport
MKIHFNFHNIFFIFMSLFYFSQKAEGMEHEGLREEPTKERQRKFSLSYGKKSSKDSREDKRDNLSSSQNSSPNTSMLFSLSPRKHKGESIKNNSNSPVNPPSDFLSMASSSHSSPHVSPKRKEDRDIEAQNILSFLNSDSSKSAHVKVQGKLSVVDFSKICQGEFSTKSASLDWSQCEGISPFFPLLFRVYSDPSLTVLDLTEEAVNDPNFAYLAYALINNTTVTTVKMHLVHTHGKQMNAIFAPFLTPCSISVMDFRNSRLNGFGHIISNILFSNPTLTSFNLSNCSFLIDDVRQIFQALSLNRSLRTLIFSSNVLGEQGGKYVKDTLRKNTTLTELDLFSTQLSASDAQGISEALIQLLIHFEESELRTKEQPQFVRTLNLGGNYFGDEGAEFMATALNTNTVLTELNLSQNNIGAKGAFYLALELPENKGLKILNLGDNSFGNEGTQLIVQSLFKNIKLASLHLQNNMISNDGVQFIPRLLRENKHLTFLDLSKNKIDPQNSLTIMDAFKEKNTSLSTLILDLFTIISDGSQYTVKIPGEIETIRAFEIGKKGYDEMHQFIKDSISLEKGLSPRKGLESVAK